MIEVRHSRAIKVIFVTFDAPDFICGPNSWLKRLLPFLRKQGFDIEILFFLEGQLADQCNCYQFFKSQGFNTAWFRWGTTTEAKITWLLSQLQTRNPDIFVPNMLVAAFYAARWVKAVGIPTIGLLHSDDLFHRGVIDGFVIGQDCYALSALVSVSEHLSKQIPERPINSTLVRTIPYGVPIPKSTCQASQDESLKLIYAGRLVEEQKRISLVIHSCISASQAIDNITTHIYGQGSEFTKLQEMIQTLEASPYIFLEGNVDSDTLQFCMLEGHIFVLMSEYEGLPIALMEAMACGLVPICTNIKSGVPELVEHEKTGILIDVDNIEEEFIQAIRKLKENPEKWKVLSDNARLKIRSQYSDEVCHRSWALLLEEMMSNFNRKKDKITIPNSLSLPPVNQYLSREDWREKTWNQQLRHYGRIWRSRLVSKVRFFLFN